MSDMCIRDSYWGAVPDSTVFIEMKKKYRSVVYKRRINTTEQEAMRYLCGGKQLADTDVYKRQLIPIPVDKSLKFNIFFDNLPVGIYPINPCLLYTSRCV